MPRKAAAHGTPEGFDRHATGSTKPCAPCEAAKEAQRAGWIAAAAEAAELTGEQAAVLAAHHAGELILGG